MKVLTSDGKSDIFPPVGPGRIIAHISLAPRLEIIWNKFHICHLAFIISRDERKWNSQMGPGGVEIQQMRQFKSWKERCQTFFFFFLSLLFGAAACRGRGNRWGRWIVNNTFKTKARGSANLMTSTGENYVAGTTFRFCFCFSVGVGRWWQSAVRARSNVSAI